MSTATAEVVNPVPADADELAKVLSFIEAHEARHGALEPAFFLSGAGEHDRVELIEQPHEILTRVVHALSHGRSISILIRDQEISTQQAAEILGLSRPTVVRLIEDGELHAHVPGAVRRKLRLADVLAYREELRERRNRFITESSAEFEDFTDAEVAEALAEANVEIVFADQFAAGTVAAHPQAGVRALVAMSERHMNPPQTPQQVLGLLRRPLRDGRGRGRPPASPGRAAPRNCNTHVAVKQVVKPLSS